MNNTMRVAAAVVFGLLGGLVACERVLALAGGQVTLAVSASSGVTPNLQ